MTDLLPLGAPSARAMMDRRLDTAVSTGVLTPEDKAVVAVALDSVDQGLARDGGTQPGSMKARIEALIAAQVDTGALSRDQGQALESFFAGSTTAAAAPVGGSAATGEAAKAAPGMKTAHEQIASFEAMLDRMRRNLTPADIYGAGSAAGSGLVFSRDA